MDLTLRVEDLFFAAIAATIGRDYFLDRFQNLYLHEQICGPGLLALPFMLMKDMFIVGILSVWSESKVNVCETA